MHVTDFSDPAGLAEAFAGADRLALIPIPFVGEKRQRGHKNAVDDPITVRYMFEHVDDYQIGERHSKDA